MRDRLLYLVAALTIIISVSISPSCSENQSVSSSPSSSSAINQHCTLTIIKGNVRILVAGSTNWTQGSDGMTLIVGTRINTLPDAKALLTFYNGSTIELDPSTDLEIQKSQSDGKSSNIVLKQSLGKTVSRVVELVDPGSRYEIQTPSAFALVRGTIFSVEIVGLNNTMVKVMEETVIVGAQGKTVSVPAGYQVIVLFGAAPSTPTKISDVSSPATPINLINASGSTGLPLAGGRGNGAISTQQVRCPEVITTDPLPRSRNQAIRRPIRAIFNVPMTTSTINTTTFFLTRNGARVTGTVTCDLQTAIFIPNVALAPLTEYTATITTGALNMTGCPLAENYNWSFSTLRVPVP